MPGTPSQSTTASVDVAIIGGGIAGSSLAITLRRQGMDVVLVEREPAFRDRIRGEAVHPWGVREIIELELRPLLDEAGALELPLWTRYRDRIPGEPYAWTSDVPDSPPELSVSHPQLQEVLIRAAELEGVRVFRPGTATPSRVPDGWSLTIESGVSTNLIFARLLIGADGKNSVTRKLLGAKAPRDAVRHQFGGMLVRGVRLPTDSAHQGYHETGFAMIFPQANDHARIYYVGPNSLQRELLGPGGVQDFLRRVAACFPEGALAQAEQAGPLGFFPNADVPVDRVAGENIALVGDAAGANDPTQGHGLSLVFRDVRVLRDALAADGDNALQAYAKQRKAYYHVLRTHATWSAPLITDTGDIAEMLREQVKRAREVDPSAGGYANIFANGPDGLATDDDARARFYGENLPGARVRTAPKDPLSRPASFPNPPE